MKSIAIFLYWSPLWFYLKGHSEPISARIFFRQILSYSLWKALIAYRLIEIFSTIPSDIEIRI